MSVNLNSKKIIFISGLFFFCLFFFSCKNFFNGEEFLMGLENSIEYQNEQNCTVYISSDYGNVLNAGEKSLKKGDTLQLSYVEGISGYKFVKWNIEPKESVEFVEDSGETKENTAITIKNSKSKISIKPVLYERPKIDKTRTLPAFVKTGVEKNNSIYFTFTKKLSPDNDFNRIKIEMTGSVEGQNTLLLGNEDAALDSFLTPTLDNYELTIAPKRNNYIYLTKDIETIVVTIPADFYYEIDGYKIPFENEQIYTYLINNQTVEQLEVSFSCDGGTITPNQRLTYSIGSTFDVLYNKNDDYIYKDWSVTAGGYIVEKCPNDEKDLTGYYKAWLKSENDEKTGEPITFLSYNKPDEATKILLENQNLYKIEFTVLENLSGVSIKPDSRLLPKINDYEPKYVNTGNDYDTKSYIYFNKEMDINSFISTNIEIIDNQNKTDYSKYFTFKGNTDNGKTVLTIIPSYDIKELFTNGKNQIDIEINLKDGIKDLNGESLSGNTSWYYRIINQSEKIKPVIDSIHLFSDSNPEAYFYRELTQKEKSKWDNDDRYDEDIPKTHLQNGDYSKNHVSKVYVCLTGYDSVSGLKCLRVKETNQTENEITEFPLTEDIIGTKDGCNVYNFQFMYNFKTENEGDLTLEFTLLDNAGNESLVQKYDLIKDTISDYDIELISENVDYLFENQLDSQNAEIHFTVCRNYSIEKVQCPIVKIEINDSCVYNDLLNLNTINADVMNKIFKGIYIDNTKENKFIITYYGEDGLEKTNEKIIPPAIDIFQVLEDENYLYIYFVDESSKYGDMEYNVMLKFNNQEHFEFFSGSQDYFSSTYFKIPKNSIPSYLGIESISLSRTLTSGFLYNTIPTKYVYKGNTQITTNNNIEFPDYKVNYSMNSSKCNVIVNKSSDFDSYLIKVQCGSEISYLSSNTFYLNVGKEYTLSMVKKVDEGCFEESKSIILNTSEEDTLAPAFKHNANYDYKSSSFAPNFYRINMPKDIDSNKNENDKLSVYLLFYKSIDYVGYRFSYFETPLPNKYMKSESINDILEKYKKIKIDSTKNYIDVPIYNSMLLYCEDDNGNNSTALISVKNEGFIVNFMPKIQYTEDVFELIIPDNIIEPNMVSYSDKYISKNLVYTYQCIYKDETMWKFINDDDDDDSFEETTILIDNTENWRKSTINLKNRNPLFVRIFTKFREDLKEGYGSSSVDENYTFFIPLYACPAYLKGDVQCNSHSWLKVFNGYQVFADAPTLCHTMYFPTKLTETNTKEDAYVWETKAIETGIMVKDSMFTYSDENLAEIPEGFYYTTICHFADGTILMSDINVK